MALPLLPKHLNYRNDKIALQTILLPRHNGCGNREWSVATAKNSLQIILLPRKNNRGNNISSLATNKNRGKR
jgi:hypothetical protein